MRRGKPEKQQRRRLNLNVEVLQAAGSPTANKAPRGEEMEVCNMTQERSKEMCKLASDLRLDKEFANEVMNELYDVLKEKGLSVEQAEALLDFTKDLIRMRARLQ